MIPALEDALRVLGFVAVVGVVGLMFFQMYVTIAAQRGLVEVVRELKHEMRNDHTAILLQIEKVHRTTSSAFAVASTGRSGE